MSWHCQHFRWSKFYVHLQCIKISTGLSGLCEISTLEQISILTELRNITKTTDKTDKFFLKCWILSHLNKKFRIRLVKMFILQSTTRGENGLHKEWVYRVAIFDMGKAKFITTFIQNNTPTKHVELFKQKNECNGRMLFTLL